MKPKISIFLFFLVSLAYVNSYAQTDTVINGKRYKIVDEKADKNKKRRTPVDSTFVIGNKKLSYYNNWLTVGGGYQQNLTYKRKAGFCGGLDFNFHIKHEYFQAGLMITGESFGFYDNYEFHVGYGKRYEDKNIHFAGFAGISYSQGYGKVGDTVYTRPFSQPGIYAQVEAIKKVTYDVGLGVSFFVDYNKEQAIFGTRLVLYFSGAYKGKRYYDGKTME